MDFASTIQKILILTPPILFAVTIHEMAHGWVAYRLGDPIAKLAGRLTLNPLKHLDPVGTFVFFVTQAIGWAKPVPVNPYNFANPRQGMMWVSLAGPGANLLVAAISAFFLRTFWGTAHAIGPAGHFFAVPLTAMAYISVQINVGLAIFNLLPIPPLDGSKVLAALLPDSMLGWYHQIERYGFFIILLLVFTGVTGRIIVPLIFSINRFLLGT